MSPFEFMEFHATRQKIKDYELFYCIKFWKMQFLHILLAIGLLNCLVHFADSQDLQIFGKFELTVTELDEKEIGRIRSKCFWGIGFPTCRPVYQDDDFVKNENQLLIPPKLIPMKKIEELI